MIFFCFANIVIGIFPIFLIMIFNPINRGSKKGYLTIALFSQLVLVGVLELNKFCMKLFYFFFCTDKVNAGA